VHNSWALVRVAKAFLESPPPRHCTHDLALLAGVERRIVDNLVTRMVIEGWLATEDGWTFEVTPAGRRAMVTVLVQAKALHDARQGRAS
jgi:hypothetical protein